VTNRGGKTFSCLEFATKSQKQSEKNVKTKLLTFTPAKQFQRTFCQDTWSQSYQTFFFIKQRFFAIKLGRFIAKGFFS
jgi:hypothetical protein